MKRRILHRVLPLQIIFKNATEKKDNKKCVRPNQNKWIYSSLTATPTCGDIKGFLITAGKVLKLVKIIWMNTVVVSSYRHPHETYTEKCWLESSFTLLSWILLTDNVWTAQCTNSASCNIKHPHNVGCILLIYSHGRYYRELYTIMQTIYAHTIRVFTYSPY